MEKMSDKELKLLEFELRNSPDLKNNEINRKTIRGIKQLITKSTNGIINVEVFFRRYPDTQKCYCKISKIKMTLMERLE